jgi:hypothetical protein
MTLMAMSQRNSWCIKTTCSVRLCSRRSIFTKEKLD